MKIFQRFLIAFLVAVAIGGSRYLYEMSCIRSDADAQGGIAILASFIICGATIFIAFILCLLSLSFFASRKRYAGTVFLIGLILVFSFTARSMIRLHSIRVALFDAAYSTSPERLRELVGYPTRGGYEIDNRIASNPSTPVDVLRSLHGKPGQTGTEMCLARNPNTPEDILIELSKIDNEWIQKSLAKNPTYKGDKESNTLKLPRQ